MTTTPQLPEHVATATPEFPDLRSRHVYLRPLGPADYGPLQQLETSGELGMRWRYRGSTPGPEQWNQGLWRAVLAQHVVVRAADDVPIGLVLAYEPVFQDGHAKLAALRFDLDDRTPDMTFGMALFIRYIFACFNLRKLYLEVTEFNYAQFASGEGRLFEVEGRLRNHVFFGGRHWDQLVLAIDRETWESASTGLLAAQTDAAGRSTRTVTLRVPTQPSQG